MYELMLVPRAKKSHSLRTARIQCVTWKISHEKKHTHTQYYENCSERMCQVLFETLYKGDFLIQELFIHTII